MRRYILHRILLTLFVIAGAALLIFTVMFFIPGDPAQILLDASATPADIEAKRQQMGLSDPFLVQLGKFMYNAFLRFDFGNSWMRGTSVIGGMLDRLPRTFLLGILTVILTTACGIPLGVNAAMHRNGWQDRGLIVAAMVFVSIPEFWLALLLIIVFSLKLGWLPSFGIESWTCYILPILSGSVGGICTLARQTRVCVLDVVNADYITTARSKGLKEHVVIYKHMLPNALIPIITTVGGSFTRCVGGTVVMEQIFSFPGVGLYLVDAINMRDYPIIRGCSIILAAFTAVLMLLVDLAYGFVDPRIKAQYVNSAKRKGNAARKGDGRGERDHRRHADDGEKGRGDGRGRETADDRHKMKKEEHMNGGEQ